MVTAEVTIPIEKLRNLKHPMQYIGIDWDTYEQISEELGESNSLHLFYDRGSLTIMPVTEIHELLTSLVAKFYNLCRNEFEIEMSFRQVKQHCAPNA